MKANQNILVKILVCAVLGTMLGGGFILEFNIINPFVGMTLSFVASATISSFFYIGKQWPVVLKTGWKAFRESIRMDAYEKEVLKHTITQMKNGFMLFFANIFTLMSLASVILFLPTVFWLSTNMRLTQHETDVINTMLIVIGIVFPFLLSFQTTLLDGPFFMKKEVEQFKEGFHRKLLGDDLMWGWNTRILDIPGAGKFMIKTALLRNNPFSWFVRIMKFLFVTLPPAIWIGVRASYRFIIGEGLRVAAMSGGIGGMIGWPFGHVLIGCIATIIVGTVFWYAFLRKNTKPALKEV